MQFWDLIEEIVSFAFVMAALLVGATYLFRVAAASAARRRRTRHSWVRAVAGGAVDAFRYFFLRMARYANLSDASMRTARTGTGNPPLNGQLFAFWVLAIGIVSGISCVLPAVFFGLNLEHVLKIVDQDGVKLWGLCYSLLFPLLIVWREREVERRLADTADQWRAKYLSLVATFGVPTELRVALQREAQSIAGVRRVLDELGEPPSPESSERAAHMSRSGELLAQLQWHMRRQHAMGDLLEHIEGTTRDAQPSMSLPRRLIEGLFDVRDALPVPVEGGNKQPDR